MCESNIEDKKKDVCDYIFILSCGKQAEIAKSFKKFVTNYIFEHFNVTLLFAKSMTYAGHESLELQALNESLTQSGEASP